MAVSLETQTLSRLLSSSTSSETEDSDSNEVLSNASSPGGAYNSGCESKCNSTHVGSGTSSRKDSDSEDSDSDDDSLPAYWWLYGNAVAQQQSLDWHTWNNSSWNNASVSSDKSSWQERNAKHAEVYGEVPCLPKKYRLGEVQRRKLSCLLSKILRHAATSWGLRITADGYVRVEDLLNIPAFWEEGSTLQDIQYVVQWEKQEGEKQRFSMRQGQCGPEIRATQGHSQDAVEGQLVTKPVDKSELPAFVLHGTFTRHLTSVLAGGLKPMRRHHVHMFLAETFVGRHDAEVLVYIDVAKAQAVGVDFLLSENGVVLSSSQIPAVCFDRVIRVSDGAILESHSDYAEFVVPASGQAAVSIVPPKKVEDSSRQFKGKQSRTKRTQAPAQYWNAKSYY